MSRKGRRMTVALLALPGVFVSLYLLLYRMGVYGQLACGAGGSCEVVQTSSWAVFLGIPVPGWGTAWYLAVLGVALTGLRPGALRARWPERALAVLSAGGVAFTAYLTAIEAFVLHAFCRWCVVSALLVSGIAAVSALGWWREGDATD